MNVEFHQLPSYACMCVGGNDKIFLFNLIVYIILITYIFATTSSAFNLSLSLYWYVFCRHTWVCMQQYENFITYQEVHPSWSVVIMDMMCLPSFCCPISCPYASWQFSQLQDCIFLKIIFLIILKICVLFFLLPLVVTFNY